MEAAQRRKCTIIETAEAAEMLGTTQAAVRRMILTGELKAQRISGCYLLKREQVEAVAAARA